MHRPRNRTLGDITATRLSDFAPQSYMESIALLSQVFSRNLCFLFNSVTVVNGVRFFN